jgi:transcriptional regulator with XRE-family HTH domain
MLIAKLIFTLKRGTMNQNKFGDIIRNARKEKKLTLDEVGKAVGWSAVYVHDVEKGNRPATQDVAVIVKLSETLGLDVVELMGCSISERNKVVLDLGIDAPQYAPWRKAATRFLAKLALTLGYMDKDEFGYIEEEVLNELLITSDDYESNSSD